MTLKVWGNPWNLETESTYGSVNFTNGYLDPDSRRLIVYDNCSVIQACMEIVRLSMVIYRLGIIADGWKHVASTLAVRHLAYQLEKKKDIMVSMFGGVAGGQE